MLRSQNRHIRVRRGLQSGNTCSDHEYRSEEQRKADHLCGRDKQQAACDLNKQGHHHGALVTDYFDQLRGRRGEHKVGQEKRRLGQHCQSIRQIEDRSQVGHQRHVQVGDEPEDEEQRGNGDERNQIARRRERRRWFGLCCHKRSVPRFPTPAGQSIGVEAFCSTQHYTAGLTAEKC